MIRLRDALTTMVVALDTETTGTDPETARLVQVCTGWSNGPGDWHPTTAIVATEVPDEAAEIHGITTEQAMAHGRPLADVIPTVMDLLAKSAAKSVPVVGHNIVYDLTLLDREAIRCGRPGVPASLIVLDTLVLGRRIDKMTGGNRLESIAGRNGITLNAHRADEDALASLKLLHALVDIDDMLGMAHVEDLHAAQVGWYYAQVQAAEYKRRGNGYAASEPNTDWPVILPTGGSVAA